MTLKKALKTMLGSSLEVGLKCDKDSNIDFDDIENQKAVRKALIEAMKAGGYVLLSMMIAQAWKVPTASKK